ncbi:winged helix-turn-helix transcriptional regulator [Actinoplanes cyaneus]
MLTASDRDILIDLLNNGDNSPSNIADNIDRHSKTVSERLSTLEDEGYVVPKGSGGVWTMTERGLHSAQILNRHRS